jgi:hypothetical protein
LAGFLLEIRATETRPAKGSSMRRHRPPASLVRSLPLARCLALGLLALLALPALPVLPVNAAPLTSTSAPVHQCFPVTLRCGESITAALNATECFIDEVSYADFYEIPATSGQQLTVTMTSADFTPKMLLFDPRPELVISQDGTGPTLTLVRTLDRSGLWRVGATSALARETGSYTLSVACSDPPPPAGAWLTTTELPGFRFKVRITAGSQVITGEKQADCVPETLCVNGAVRGRSEIFLRILGPRSNGFFWPEIIKFTTSQVEVWIEQLGSGQINYYLLTGSTPASTDLPGLFDRTGFEP